MATVLQLQAPPANGESKFHCCAEWHLAKALPAPCYAIYSFAMRISKNSGKFSASAVSVAGFLGLSEKTVRRCYQKLAALGFFELLQRAKFESSIFRVLSHEQWRSEHPGRCTVEADPDLDPLAEDLYKVSGGSMKFKQSHLSAFRGTGLTDLEIVESLESYTFGHDTPTSIRRFVAAFLCYLRQREKEKATTVTNYIPRRTHESADITMDDSDNMAF